MAQPPGVRLDLPDLFITRGWLHGFRRRRCTAGFSEVASASWWLRRCIAHHVEHGKVAVAKRIGARGVGNGLGDHLEPPDEGVRGRWR